MRPLPLCLAALFACSSPVAPKRDSLPDAATWWPMQKGEWWKDDNPCPSGAKLVTGDQLYYCTKDKSAVSPGARIEGMYPVHEVFVLRTLVAGVHALPKVHGQYTAILAGKRFDALAYDGKAHGQITFGRKDAQGEAFAENGQLQGAATIELLGKKWRGVFARGKLMEASFEGKVEVASGAGKIETSRFGSKVRGQFAGGYASGEWIFATGELSGIIRFTDPGVAKATFDQHGITAQASFQDWLVDGELRTDYPGQTQESHVETFAKGRLQLRKVLTNNQPIREISFFNFERHGPAQWFWHSGKPRAKGAYDRGFPTGKFTYYDPTGKEIETRTIENGTGRLFLMEAKPLLSRVWKRPMRLVAPLLERIIVGEIHTATCDVNYVDRIPTDIDCLLAFASGQAKFTGKADKDGAQGDWKITYVANDYKREFLMPFRAGLLHGKMTATDSRGGMSFVHFEEGRLNGPTKTVAANYTEEGNYKAGVPDGILTRKTKSSVSRTKYMGGSVVSQRVLVNRRVRQTCSMAWEHLRCTVFDKRGKKTAEGTVTQTPKCSSAVLPRSEWPVPGACANGSWTLYKGSKVSGSQEFRLGQLAE